MLYLDNPQEIDGVTVYPDTHLDYVFYLIPPYPRFRRDSANKPVFQMIKFRGGVQSGVPMADATSSENGKEDAMMADAVPTIDGEVAGGFLTFDTEYAVAAEAKEKILQKLDEQVRAQYLRQGRGMPEGFQIVLRQPTWTDGDVRLLMEDTNQGLFTCVSKSGKPSLMGNNVSSFASVLAPWQASLFVDALEHTNFTPIQVNYHLKYLAKVPPVRIHIYASAYDCYTMYKQYGREINGGGACSDPDTVIRSISEHVWSRDVVQISIDSGGLTVEDKTFQTLQEMALGLVQDWIKENFYKPPPERASKEQIQDIQLRSLTETDFRDLNIHIEQNATVEMSIYPQGTLGKLITEGDNLNNYIREVDLSADEFYQKRRVSVKVYADFPVAGAAPQPTDIQFVEVTAYYGSGPGTTHTWDASGAGSSSANGGRWEVEWHKEPGVTELRWEARIRFRELSKEMVLKGVSDKTELNIAVAAPGRARLRLDHIGMPWSLVQYLEANIRFQQEDAEPQEVERILLVDEKSDEQWFDEAIWTKRTQPFYVSLAFYLKNGNKIQQAEHLNIEVKGDRYDIKSPFEQYLEVPIQALYTTPTWKEDVVDLVYQDAANQYQISGQLFLSEKGGWRLNWSVPLLDTTKRSFRYFWTRRNVGGGVFTSKDIANAPVDGWFSGDQHSVVETGDPLSDEDMLRVTVDPLILVVGLPDATKTVVRVVVHMKYVQPDGRADVDDHTFNKGDTAWQWVQHIKDKSKKEYMWWAECYTNPYSKIALGTEAAPFRTEAETVVIEPPVQ
jgi:hypothetical protein